VDWSATTLWWVLTGVLVAAELATGTFHLLMLALGAAAGALAAHAGLGPTAQMVCAALVAGGASLTWSLRQRRTRSRLAADADPDVNPDIGRDVHVDSWDAEGTARVQYRGAAWSARYAGSGTPQPGTHVIVAVQGSQLQLAPR
jgi:membrane protein implicated in regulation of membrane protease activity